MTSDKGLFIRAVDFDQAVPRGTWIRQHEGPAPRNVILPIEGILSQEPANENLMRSVKGLVRPIAADTALTVTPISAIDTVRLYAGQCEYKIGDEWVDFRELCLRAIEHRLKDGLRVDPAHIGGHLYAVATWLEAQGNRGHSDEEIMIGLPLFPIRLLSAESRPLWENIVFFGEGDGKNEYSGWGVHKRTPAHWWITWLDRFGLAHPQADQIMSDVWDEALAEHNKRSLKRVHQTYAGIDMEMTETREIAHKAAAMWLLSQWAEHRAWAHWEARDMWRLQASVYDMAHKVFRHELLYRQDGQPQKRRSKKKTQAARDDWATAGNYFSLQMGFQSVVGFNAHTFYTAAYIKACCDSDAAPDVVVDFDALPRDVEAHEVTEGASEREAQR